MASRLASRQEDACLPDLPGKMKLSLLKNFKSYNSTSNAFSVIQINFQNTSHYTNRLTANFMRLFLWAHVFRKPKFFYQSLLLNTTILNDIMTL